MYGINCHFEGNVEEFRQVAYWLKNTAASAQDTLASDLQITKIMLEEQWAGETARTAGEWLSQALVELESSTSGYHAVAEDIFAFSDTLEASQKAAASILEDARYCGLTVVGSSIFPPSSSSFIEQDDYNALVEKFESLLLRSQDLQEAYDAAVVFLKERLIAPHRDELQSFTTLYEGASGVIEGVAYHKGVKSSIKEGFRLERYAKDLQRKVIQDPVSFGGAKAGNRVLDDVDSMLSRAHSMKTDFSPYSKIPKSLKVGGGILTVLGLAKGTYDDIKEGESYGQALVSNTVATGVSAGTSFLAAAGTSMAYGALFGSAVPGVGTVIGAAVGIGVGIISYTLADDFVDWLWG